jgi:hypothetical protein
MTRRSKRELEREIDGLSPDDSDDAPMMLKLTHISHPDKQWPEWSDSPHPELTVRPHPEQKPKSLSIAVPNLIADAFTGESILCVTTCENAERYRFDPESDDGVTACEMCDALSDDDLRREYEIRQENGDPIPELLEEHDPEE